MATYACADLHGCYWAWQKIKEYIKPNDMLYFLGDAVDRGEDGIKICQEILYRPNTIYLRGNHEEMMIQTELHGKGRFGNWIHNGGHPTCAILDMMPDNERDEFLRRLDRKMINYDCYINTSGKMIYMSHSGAYHPYALEDFYWDRTHFIYDEDAPENTYIIHGHTPYVLVQEDRQKFCCENPDDEIINGVYKYCNGKKWDLDCGTYWTNICALMNLDTFEIIKFEKDK